MEFCNGFIDKNVNLLFPKSGMLHIMKTTLTQVELASYLPLIHLGCDSAQLLHTIVNPLTTAKLSLCKATTYKSPTKKLSQSLSDAHAAVSAACDAIHAYRPKMESKQKWFHPEKSILKQLSALKSLAKNTQVRLDPFLQSNIRCYADAYAFEQVVFNLVRNAVESYQHTKTVRDNRAVEITLTATVNTLTVIIQDWGCGIPESQQHRIFELFYSTKKYHTGIGLALVRKIVEVDLRGTLAFTSQQDTTIFTVTLPIQPT